MTKIFFLIFLLSLFCNLGIQANENSFASGSVVVREGSEVGNKPEPFVATKNNYEPRNFRVFEKKYFGQGQIQLEARFDSHPWFAPSDFDCVAIFANEKLTKELGRSCNENRLFHLSLNFNVHFTHSLFVAGIHFESDHSERKDLLTHDLIEEAQTFWTTRFGGRSSNTSNPLQVEIKKVSSRMADPLILKNGKAYNSLLATYQMRFKADLTQLQKFQCLFFSNDRIQKMIPLENPALLSEKDKVEICNDGDIDSFARKVEALLLEKSYFLVPQIKEFCAGTCGWGDLVIGFEVSNKKREVYHDEKFLYWGLLKRKLRRGAF